MKALILPHINYYGKTFTAPFKVVCVHDENKPNDIPNSLWIEHDKVYTVKEIRQSANGICFVLEELDLRTCYPYEGFSVERFALSV
jgi:hypothetical protein